MVRHRDAALLRTGNQYQSHGSFDNTAPALVYGTQRTVHHTRHPEFQLESAIRIGYCVYCLRPRLARGSNPPGYHIFY